MIKQPLHDTWTVRAVGDLSEVPAALRDLSVDAQVPGCVHTDLMRAGKIPDPYRGLDEFQTRWIGHTDWAYRTTFEADAAMFDHERIDLVCDGLDTVARIELNGSLVAETFNMHRGYRFDVRNALKRGTNELVLTFASPVKYAEATRAKIGSLPYVNGPAGPFNFIRKMACNFGWDWGPALPTCGIWRGIRLEAWNKFRLGRPRIHTKSVSEAVAMVEIMLSVELASIRNTDAYIDCPMNISEWWDRKRKAAASGEIPGFRLRAGEIHSSLTASMQIDYPQLWWPHGHGAQPLYGLNILAFDLGQDVSEEFSTNIGLRTVELDTSPDDIGRKFIVKVNGKPIFCKGFNWIPDDCFLDRACEPSRVRQRIQQAVDAGGNMLRVWGGGIFETDDFYNICDEMGVLVWQDFLFACAMYPEEQPFWDEVEAEARYNVSRLAHHPSLAIWNGCNENIWAYRDWGWKDHEDVKGPADGIQRTWGKGFYFDLLPKVIAELDPSRPYWAGSPWSGDYDVDNGVPPNAATHGNKHVWEAWFKEDYAVYRKFEPRFCSEFGFQGPAPYSSIANVVPVEARDFGSPEMRHRQKSGNAAQDDGDRRNLRHLVRHFKLDGAQALLDALDSERLNPKPTAPPCGAGPLHPAIELPSRVNFDDLHYLLSVNQSRALTLGVEWFRSRQPTCMGTLYWQLNDCWPGGTTWSCIDGDGKPKLLWYATRRFYAAQLLTIQPAGADYQPGDPLSLFAINDSDEPGTHRAWVRRFTFDGRVLAEQEVDLTWRPRGVTSVALNESITTPADSSREMIAIGSPAATFWFFRPDRELHYPPAAFESEWADGKLTIHAKSLLRDLCVFADRLDPQATVSEQLITLLPGDSFSFEVASESRLSLHDLTHEPVLRSVNRFSVEAST
jgi:beta-mannosidase